MNRTPNRPTTLSLDADLIEAARVQALNLSAITEDAPRKRIAEEDTRRWLVENGETIAARNAWTAERGLFSDEFRGW